MDETAICSGQELMAELEEIYRRYLEESEALFREGTGFLHAIRSVLGTNTIKSSGIHRKFYDAVESQVTQLAERLEASPDPLLADRAARLLLEERPKGQNVTQYGWISAAQTLAIPLLPHASRETLEELYAAYCAAHPKRDRLPRQVELVEALERQLNR